MSNKKVFIVNNYGEEYTLMFEKRGWEIVTELKDADLLQFVGGSDVDPSIYAHHRHRLTTSVIERDLTEKLFFLAALNASLPMAGICRGGQFLNVMCGGTLWQHVEGHRGSHKATYTDFRSKRTIKVTSTHHQMMKPRNLISSYFVLMVAHNKMRREGCTSLEKKKLNIIVTDAKNDMEALYYKEENALCFQPHPEFGGEKKLASLYFSYIDRLLMK